MIFGMISFNYPAWLMALCLLFAILVTGISYYKYNPFGEIATWKRQLLVVLRFVATFLVALLLLQPLFTQKKSTIEKPLLPVVVDRSQSILGSAQGRAAADEIPAFLKDIQNELSNAYEIVPVDFALRLLEDSLQFDGLQTDFGNLFLQLKQRFGNSHLAGTVLLTDGIPTRGQAPEFLAQNFSLPVFAIGLGDTTPRVDARVFDVIVNKTVFKDNLFQVEVFVKGDQLTQQTGELVIAKNGKKMASKIITFTSNRQTVQHTFVLEAEEIGLQKYTATIAVFDNEINVENNKQDFFVEVKDRKKKIVIVANNPNPDIAAFRKSIETFESYDLDIYYKNDIIPDITDAHLLVLHQVPSRGDRGLPNTISSFPNNILYVLGPEMDLRDWQRFQEFAKISTSPAFENLTPVTNAKFSLFQLESNEMHVFNNFPPLRGFMNEFQFSGTGEALLTSKIARVATNRPLIFLGTHANRRYGIINGTGFWRWRLYNFKEERNHKAFDNLIGQMMQYLTTKELEERLTISVPTRVYENEPLVFSARLLDANMAVTNVPELNIKLVGSQRDVYDYVFNKSGDRYSLRLNGLPADQYNYTATATIGGETLTKKGSFIVEKVAVEFLDLQARFDWLGELSQQTTGKFYGFDDRNQLIKDLSTVFKTPALLKTTTDTEPLLSWRVLLFIIVTLLGAEWFLRKYFGAY